MRTKTTARIAAIALARSLGFDAVQGYLFRDRFPPARGLG